MKIIRRIHAKIIYEIETAAAWARFVDDVQIGMEFTIARKRWRREIHIARTEHAKIIGKVET